jgi:hypothetical protein
LNGGSFSDPQSSLKVPARDAVVFEVIISKAGYPVIQKNDFLLHNE